ncbi:MAG TPA: crotonyl-CoA carboxylase/reductase [Solirubrobacterales bacterium]|nr:crotonyl-CoA carboxylase/reductase [Solirubrobacterales bacterium]
MSVLEAVLAGASAEEIRAAEVPGTYRAAYLDRADAERMAAEPEKDVRRTLKVGEVPMPELAPDEALVAVMAGAMNYNTIWSARFEPIPTFRFLDQLARTGGWNERHAQDQHVIGSDAAGVVVRTGSAVRRWSVGDPVVIFPLWTDAEDAFMYEDLLEDDVRAWGFETNFGGLAHFTVVKATQLMPKPRHLTWEEAACNTTCAMTSYRMLVSENGARFKQGDIVFIWGAAGGLGAYAVQLVRNGGGVAVGVVDSEEKAELLEELDCNLVIRRDQDGLDDLDGKELGKAMGAIVRRELGEDPHVVFEHVGAKTFPASVFMVRRGGAVVTCGSSTGYEHNFDNRYLWMRVKRIIGSHAATLQEALECNRLIEMGMVQPALTDVFPLEEAAEAAYRVQRNAHVGKVGVLALAPEEGLGVEDPERRAQVGEARVGLFRKYG